MLRGRAARRFKDLAARLLMVPERIDPRRIGILWRTPSGSNATALYRKAKRAEDAGYAVDLIRDSGGSVGAALARDRRIARCGIVVSTHGPRTIKRGQRAVELWHGFPLKALGLMDAGLGVAEKRALPRRWAVIGLIASYSAFYATAMNACYPARSERYRSTGMPRNDLLFRPEARKLLHEVLGLEDSGARVIFNMPTYRDGGQGCPVPVSDNAFGFSAFDEAAFGSFLARNGMVLVHKLHPNDEARLRRSGTTRTASSSPAIRFLDDATLEEAGLDLYDLLGGIDALVTDYSSVYFDLLLRDVPTVFCPTDLEEYRKSRSFLLEPYDLWTPGPKALDQKCLEAELLRSVSDHGYYAGERARLRRIVHEHDDAGSADRVWEAILEMAACGR